MEQFNFLSLPLAIKEMIVNEIVHNSMPDDWIHFAQTSKYSNWLVRRANPKKIINDLRILQSFISFKAEINGKLFTSMAETMEILRDCQIRKMEIFYDFFLDFTISWTPELEAIFLEASKYLTELKILFKIKITPRTIKFFQNLLHLNCLSVEVRLSTILHFPKLPSNIFLYNADKYDKSKNFLQKFARKTKMKPLSSLILMGGGFTVDNFHKFLQTATFNDGAKICFGLPSWFSEDYLEDRQVYMSMLASMGEHEFVDVNHVEECKQKFPEMAFMKECRQAILLKENVKIISSDVNAKLNGIFLFSFTPFLIDKV